MIDDRLIERSPSAPFLQTDTNQSRDLTIASSVDQMLSLTAAWSALHHRYASNVPDSHPDLFTALCDSDGTAKPYLVLFSAHSEPQAILIARHESRRLTCWFSSLKLRTPSVRILQVAYGGLICDSSDDRIISALVDHLCHLLKSGKADLIEFYHLPLNHPILPELRSHLGSRLCIERRDMHWQLDIGENWEIYFSTFSKKHRYNVRRADRLLVEHFAGDVTLREFRGLDHLEEFITTTAELSSKTWQATQNVHFKDSKGTRQLLNYEAQSDRFRGYWLVCSGKPIAFQFGAIYNGTYVVRTMGYLDQYADLSPGTVLHVRVLEHLCRSGIRHVDYIFGDQEYKRIYGTNSWEEAIIYAYAGGIRPRLTRFMLYAAKVVQSLRATLKTKMKSIRSKPERMGKQDGPHIR